MGGCWAAAAYSPADAAHTDLMTMTTSTISSTFTGMYAMTIDGRTPMGWVGSGLGGRPQLISGVMAATLPCFCTVSKLA